MDALLWGTGSRHMTDMKRGDSTHTKYQFNPTYMSQDIFVEVITYCPCQLKAGV